MTRRSIIVCSLVLAAALAGASLGQARRGGPGGGGGPMPGGNGPRPGGPGGSPQFNSQTLVGVPQQWEYGRLDCIIEKNDKETTAKVMWHAAGGEMVDAKNFGDLFIKLGGTAEAPQEWDDLDVWNLLGEKGWEYCGREVNNVAGAQGKSITSARFKRIKH